MSNDVVSIFIPTRGRAEQLKKNMRLLRNNTHYPTYELLIIADADDKDTLRICDKEKLDYIVMLERSYFATKINFAFPKAGGNYLVCLSDDVEPQPDWLGIAVDAFRKAFSDDTGVLCFDDGGEWEFVIAPHPFISRKWIDRFQHGKWVLWPQYWHNYGDTEITIVSHAIGKFLWCPESKVIHHRPQNWGEADSTWKHIVNEIHPRDCKIYNQRLLHCFPGYGPEKIEIPFSQIELHNQALRLQMAKWNEKRKKH